MYAFETSERAMQAAGRLSSHQYLDMRSAKRAHQKSRKYFQKTSKRENHCRCCEFPRYNQRRIERARDNRYALQDRVWEDVYEAEAEWEDFIQYLDPVERYAMMGSWEDCGPSGKDGTGEDFGMWGRRRIMEMRKCKEDRIRKAQQQQKQPFASFSTEKHTTKLIQLPPADSTPTISTTSLPPFDIAPTIPTTLPLSSWDKIGHEVLTEVLTVDKLYRYFCRQQKRPAFRMIHGYYWFGEYDWAYHRNASGCREFGWLWPDQGCGWNVWVDSWWNPCYCEEFKDTVPPEDVQRCSLVEWVSGRLWDVMMDEEERKETEVEEPAEEMEWELMSNAASQGWSVVSDDEFEVI